MALADCHGCHFVKTWHLIWGGNTGVLQLQHLRVFFGAAPPASGLWRFPLLRGQASALDVRHPVVISVLAGEPVASCNCAHCCSATVCKLGTRKQGCSFQHLLQRQCFLCDVWPDARSCSLPSSKNISHVEASGTQLPPRPPKPEAELHCGTLHFLHVEQELSYIQNAASLHQGMDTLDTRCQPRNSLAHRERQPFARLIGSINNKQDGLSACGFDETEANNKLFFAPA